MGLKSNTVYFDSHNTLGGGGVTKHVIRHWPLILHVCMHAVASIFNTYKMISISFSILRVKLNFYIIMLIV